jgi:hypothetical protein
MRHHRLRAELTETRRAFAKPAQVGERIEEMQLKRLASAVLSKSPDDLAALAETNPTIVWEWIDAFRRQKVEAEAEMRYWAAAMAALSTVRPAGVRAAAE